MRALAERVEELRNDRSHGASWLARHAVEALVEVARAPAEDADQLRATLVDAGRQLAASRPDVGAIAGAVGRLLASAHWRDDLPVDHVRVLVQEEANALLDARRRASSSIAIQLRDRLADATVITHSASATVREAVTVTPPRLLVCTVSRPLEEGRAFSRELAADRVSVELVEDDDAVRRIGNANLLLVGADTVFRDGTVCNKVGTRPLAEAAAAAGIPTVFACEVIKLAPTDAPPADPSDLFDVTPPELVTEVVTEEGSFAPDEIQALIDRTPFLRDGYALLAGAPA